MATFKPADVSRISDAETRNVLAQMQENLRFMFGQLGAGNFNSDVWDTLTATPVTVAKGGQGNDTLPLNRLLYGSDTDPVASVALPAVAGSVLRQNTSGAPYYTSPADFLKVMAGSGLGATFSTWGNFGRIIDTSHSFKYYANLSVIVLSATKIMLKMTGKFETDYNATYYAYGISIPLLTAQITTWLNTLGITVSSLTFDPKSQWLGWNYTTGALMYNNMQYGTCFEVDTANGIIRPARVYDVSNGAVGGWQISIWYNTPAYFETTIFATVA